MQEICSEAELRVSKAVSQCRTESIALSGGLDSSILASRVGKQARAFTVVAKDFPSSDLVNAQLVANKCGLDLTVVTASLNDLLEAADQTIKILKVFNPIEIRNNVVVYLAMRSAKRAGHRSMMTGDGADELFAGYNFFQRMSMPDLEKDLERIWKIMHFPSRAISEHVGIRLHTPFLQKEVAEWARSIPADLKVREEGGSKHGKWILRKAFEGSLPKSIVWRQKAAMQDGSGTSGLTGFFDSIIPDRVFSDKAKTYLERERVILQSKESLYYYEIYRKYYAAPVALHTSKNSCPNCKYSVDEGARFCRMCGSYPI